VNILRVRLGCANDAIGMYYPPYAKSRFCRVREFEAVWGAHSSIADLRAAV
jgi:hypothetical protein